MTEDPYKTEDSDIKRYRQAEEKLRESEKKYRFLFENSPSAIVLIDNTGKIIDVNPATERMIGFKRGELIGKKYANLNIVLPKYLPKLIERLKKIIKGEKLPSIDVKLKRKDGCVLWVNFNSSLLKVDDDIYIQVMGHDITERRKAQDELFRTSERASFYKDLFAHDMKNILAGISGSAELCLFYKDKPDKLNEIDKLLDIIREQTSRGSLLISNVQKLFKIEESETPIEKTDVNLILNDAIEFILRSYQNREIKINISGNEPNCYAQANELLLDVFENILINSVKHNDNPTIEIQIKISKEKKKKKKYLKMEFIDNGKGISDVRKETIFQRASDKDRSVRGMGLGLSLVKFIIDSYNGDLLVKNRIRGDYTKGSNFIVFIPEV